MPALSAPRVRSRTFSALALMLASALASTALSADFCSRPGLTRGGYDSASAFRPRRCSVRRPACAAPTGGSWCSGLCQNREMEVTWYGHSCIRLRGREAVVVADPYQAVVGPTGRGISGDIVTFSHPDDRPLPRAKGKPSRDGKTLLPTSLDNAFVLDGPGEYEVKEVLITGVRTLPRRCPRRPIGEADIVRRRARRRAHDPPRRDRSSADRGEARLTSVRSISHASRSAAHCRRRRPQRSSRSSIPPSSSRCRCATRMATAKTS